MSYKIGENWFYSWGEVVTFADKVLDLELQEFPCNEDEKQAACVELSTYLENKDNAKL